MKHWFVNINEEIEGPYDTEELKDLLVSGKLGASTLIWGRPLKEWVKASSWLENHESLITNYKTGAKVQMWHYAFDGETVGPITRPELIDALKKIPKKGEVLLWTKGMKSWMEVFEFHDILSDLGLNRREHPRARIEGTVVLKVDDQTMIGQLVDISAGGIGIKNAAAELTPGQVISVEVASDALYSDPIMATATVQYVTPKGVAGIKFQRIHLEAKNRIIDYVNGFRQSLAA